MFWQNVFINIVSAISIAIIFFIIKEWIPWFRMPSISGMWKAKLLITNSSYNPHVEMMLGYNAYIYSIGTKIFGTAEKITEKTKDNPIKEYIGKNRTRMELEGSIQKNYLSWTKVIIHAVERGEKRDSSVIFRLKLKNKKMLGYFSSSAGDSSGEVLWEMK